MEIMNDLGKGLIQEIKRRVPEGMSPIDFFCGILPMKKESAYRRLRGEVPLTLEETQKIALKLNISLDKLLMIKEDGVYATSIVCMDRNDPLKAYLKTMQQIMDAMRYVQLGKDAKIYSATNILPYSHIFKYPLISKFRLFKWAYQCRKTLNPLKLSEIKVPEDIRRLEETYLFETQKINTTYVWTRNIFGPAISDMRYFYEIGLVSKEEFELLLKELSYLLDDLEQDITTGTTNSGAQFLVYLSNTYSDSNYIYIEGNNFRASSINVYGVNFYSSIEPEICEDTCEWITSLMRYSTLISKSGEIDRIKFFNLQRRFIENPNQVNIHEIYF